MCAFLSSVLVHVDGSLPACTFTMQLRSPGLLVANRLQRAMPLLQSNLLAVAMTGCDTCMHCTRKNTQVMPFWQASGWALHLEFCFCVIARLSLRVQQRSFCHRSLNPDCDRQGMLMCWWLAL